MACQSESWVESHRPRPRHVSGLVRISKMLEEQPTFTVAHLLVSELLLHEGDGHHDDCAATFRRVELCAFRASFHAVNRRT